MATLIEGGSPYVGALVLLVDPDGNQDIYPAIVTRVLVSEKGRVNLTAFPPGVTPYPVRTPIEFSAAKEKGTWHWGKKEK